MEFYLVNFEVIEEAFMSAESKEKNKTVFLAIATSSLDSEVKCLNSDNLPASLRNLPKVLNISNDRAITVRNILINSVKLVNYIPSQLDERVHWHFNDG